MADPGAQTISRAARRYTLGVLVAVYTFNFVDRQILAILLPSIRAEFGVDDWVLGFLAGSAFALFYATLGVPIALLGDRWNRRNLISIAVAIWSAMTALSGAATSIVQLALARIGVGVGEAGFSPPAHSMISDLYAPHERSTAMGIFTLGISIGIMLAYYRMAGLLAVGALAVYVLLVLGGLAGLGATLTLPGIAGLILSVGMAVDANVLIFERIREELRAGRATRTAVDEGFGHALSAIVDANITTLITALILFQFGTGPVRGFAVTLSIGIVSSFFSALFVTRTLFLMYLSGKKASDPISI